MSDHLAAAYAHCEALVREDDHDAWLAALFAPATSRPHLHALEAFFAEIRQVRDRVRQPLAGELRLQWWRDAIEGDARGAAEAHPVAAALLDTVRRRDPSPGILIDAIEAHRIALYGEPPATVGDLEAFFDRTIGGSIRSRARVLGGSPPDGAVRHAAAALGVAHLLRHLSHFVARRFSVIPDELLRRHGLGQGDLAAERHGFRRLAIGAVLGDLRALARSHLAALRAMRPGMPATAGPAFLTVSLVDPLLRLSERNDSDPFAGDLAPPPWRRHVILWRAARRGRVA